MVLATVEYRDVDVVHSDNSSVECGWEGAGVDAA